MRGGLEQQAALGRLIEATGRTVLTASTSYKPALEDYHGHGVFTYALLDGLSRAERDNDGMIEVSELATYVDRTVPEITEKAFHVRQLPQMNIQGSDFALVKKTDGLVEATASAPVQPAPSASTDIPAKPNYVTSELAKYLPKPVAPAPSSRSSSPSLLSSSSAPRTDGPSSLARENRSAMSKKQKRRDSINLYSGTAIVIFQSNYKYGSGWRRPSDPTSTATGTNSRLVMEKLQKNS